MRRASFVSQEIEPSNVPRKSIVMGEPIVLPGVDAERIGTYSSHGMKPGVGGAAFAKINQDRGLITYPFNEDPNVALLCVFDGHGSNGEQVSEYVMWKVQELLLADAAHLAERAEECLIRAFEEADKQLAASAVSAKVSGAAAVVCLIIGNTLYAANAGDSRATLASRGDEGDVVVTPVTIDQKPDSPQEEARILSCGGHVTKGSPLLGPPRVWVRQGEGPGLAMARSLGDHVCKHVGVVATPEVRRYELDPSREQRLLLASDGVFEFIENQPAMDIVFAHAAASDACVALIDESSRRWREAEGNYRDDITAIVCHLPLFPARGGSALTATTLKVKPPELPTPREDAATAQLPPPDPAASANDAATDRESAKFEQRRLSVENEHAEDSAAAQRMEELRKQYGGITGQ